MHDGSLATLDDVVWFQLEAGHIHEAVLDAASEQGGEPDGGRRALVGTLAPQDVRPIATAVC